MKISQAEAGKKTIQERFQHLLAVISSERFLKKQGLGNEVPFFICPYPPEESIEMERLQKQLRNKLAQTGIRVLSIDLYLLLGVSNDLETIFRQTHRPDY